MHVLRCHGRELVMGIGFNGWGSDESNDFARGVAAMREAVVRAFECPAPYDFVVLTVRAMPDPEDKP